MKFIESTIKTFSGLSSEIKPTISLGNNVPNGSRWREVDTGDVYFFNASDDKWYLKDENLKSISGALPIVDVRALDMFEQILITLKKIEYHLALATDTSLGEDI